MASNGFLQKYIILLNMDNPIEGYKGKYTGSIQKLYTTHYVLTTLIIDNGTKFENNIMNKY